MGVLYIILKVGHSKIISAQIFEQKILMWFLSENFPKRNKLAEKNHRTKQEKNERTDERMNERTDGQELN